MCAVIISYKYNITIKKKKIKKENVAVLTTLERCLYIAADDKVDDDDNNGVLFVL